MPYNTYPYELPPLRYPYNALEPHIDAETMRYHHDKHFQAYINNLNAALAPHPKLQQLTLPQLLSGRFELPGQQKSAILDNGGGVYNHTLFFNGLSAAGRRSHMPQGELAMRITKTFGSFEAFKRTFNQQAAALFGSGWTILAIDRQKRLWIVNLNNQDTVVPKNLRSLVAVDVWEHAYYLKYKNARADYLNAIWNVLDFPVLER